MSIENLEDTPRMDDDLGTPPQSRIEQVLMDETIKPQSRIEKLLLEGGGGGGGTTNYENLQNLPKINNTTLIGNKTSSDLGLVAAESGKGLSTNDYTTAEKTKLAELTNDYTDLTNKPQINSVQLVGNKSTADLGIVEPWVGTTAEYAQQSASIPAGTPYIITDDDYTAPCYFDSATGELYVNGVKILAVMDEASYEALETKSNIWYATYPTPTPSLLIGGAKSSGNEEEPEELKEQDEKEPETKKNMEMEISDEVLEKLPPFGFGGYGE